MVDSSEVSRLVAESAGGSQAAWNNLVCRYAPLVMAVIRSYQLAAADAQDVSQTVWLRLVEHLAELRRPEALPGWLVTTAQRECVRQLRQGRRVVPVDPSAGDALPQGTVAGPDAEILRAELRQALRDGLAELSARDQRLLGWRAEDPPKPYQEISMLLGIAVGSVGPTLRRCLDRLRETTAMRAYLAAASGAGGGAAVDSTAGGGTAGGGTAGGGAADDSTAGGGTAGGGTAGGGTAGGGTAGGGTAGGGTGGDQHELAEVE